MFFAFGLFHPNLTRSSSNADMSRSSNDEILTARSSSFTKRRSLFVWALTVDDEVEKVVAEPRAYV